MFNMMDHKNYKYYLLNYNILYNCKLNIKLNFQCMSNKMSHITYKYYSYLNNYLQNMLCMFNRFYYHMLNNHCKDTFHWQLLRIQLHKSNNLLKINIFNRVRHIPCMYNLLCLNRNHQHMIDIYYHYYYHMLNNYHRKDKYN